ncbi:RNA 2',3'-cyclic phosphodiesterase [Roseospira marina]|uniref:RNA 2',3'-cyclic phosphodiesterase n=1 Tax=Roseospira marina TaxID=140057 RepID=A0A5M6IGJ2_9PROT|nr:RNA 2',3'-cyclic phosphodiesterase [Roseospira marina]KAA5607426.1 RNA 2',3'-cyclic phosphodiesterase [Roseospira marina]MBB4312398.1 2'-5' RNA ligase [Roseospira marina]MBB5085586.1 2'-5' RNA ligase [Roseospira marina]
MRLFIGLEPPADLRCELAALAIGLPGARWVAADNLHMTLRFLGEVDPAGAEDLDAELRMMRAAPPTVSLQGIGTFGQGRKIHTLWVGAHREPALVHLRDRVEAAAVRAGFAPEGRKFTPHVTLARLKAPDATRLEGFIGAYNDRAFPPFTATEVVLFESHLTRDGAQYEALERYPLA